MSIIVPVLLFILITACCAALDILGWRDFRHWKWLVSVLVSLGGNIMFFLMMGYYNSLAVSQRESTQLIVEMVPYSRYAIVCAMFAFFLVFVTLLSIVFWVGKYMINKEEGTYFRG